MKKIILTLCILLSMTANADSLRDSILALVPSDGSVYRHGYSELSAEDKAKYDYTIRAILRFEPNYIATYGTAHGAYLDSLGYSMDYTPMTRWLMRMYDDVPELYLMSSVVPRFDDARLCYYARIMGVYTPKKYLEEMLKIDSICTTFEKKITPQMSDYQKFKTLHDEFITWAHYGGMSSAYAGGIKGGFLERACVCEGYSRSFLYLCQRSGLKCIYIGGKFLNKPEEGTWTNHAWNFVELEGKWYLVDLTSDGGLVGSSIGYGAFLRGQEYFNAHYNLLSNDGGDSNLNGKYQALPTLSETDYVPSSSANIVQPNSSKNSTKTYDLQGRLIKENQRGLTIQDGRIVIRR